MIHNNYDFFLPVKKKKNGTKKMRSIFVADRSLKKKKNLIIHVYRYHSITIQYN